MPAKKAVSTPSKRTPKAKRPARATPPALPPETYFMVDGMIPSGSWDDAVFLADYLADTRGRPVEIRRTVEVEGTPNVYVRRPFDAENREQISCLKDCVVLDGDRVVFKGTFDGAMGFLSGRRGGVMCQVSVRTVSDAQQKDDDTTKREQLENDLRRQPRQIEILRSEALRHGLTASVKAFERAILDLGKE